MKRLSTLMSVLLLAALLLAGCAGEGRPTSTPQSKTPISPVAQKGTPEQAQVWQTRWDNVLQGARNEGRVVVYGPTERNMQDALTRRFQERYEVSVDYMAGTGPIIAGRIDAERRGTLYIPDVLIGASSPVINQLKPAGYMDPLGKVLILPEVVDPGGWWNDEFPWVDKDHYAVAFGIQVDPPVIINTELVKPDQMKYLSALVDPRWKSKIVMFDPTIYGPAQWFVSSQAELMGVDYLRQLARQEPLITQDRRLLTEWVARGKYPIGIAAGEAVQDFIDAGAPVQHADIIDTTHVGASIGFLSLPNRAPHPNASTLFINWLLSREGQAVYQEATKRPSTRKDISTASLNPAFVPKAGRKYYPVYTEEYLMKGKEQLDLGKEIFGYLLK